MSYLPSSKYCKQLLQQHKCHILTSLQLLTINAGKMARRGRTSKNETPPARRSLRLSQSPRRTSQRRRRSKSPSQSPPSSSSSLSPAPKRANHVSEVEEHSPAVSPTRSKSPIARRSKRKRRVPKHSPNQKDGSEVFK